MVDERETAESLRSEIEHLRRLAANVTDQRARAAIEKMIEELERRLQDLEERDAQD